MTQSILIFLLGLGVVTLGAELVLRAAACVATLLGVSRLIIGLTIVSVGTSTPELAVGIAAALSGKGSLAVGNIAGTNILNLLFILGLSALIRPLPTRHLAQTLDVPVMIGSALGLILVAWDGVIQQSEGLLLMLAAAVYTVIRVRVRRLQPQDGADAATACDPPPGQTAPMGARSGWWHAGVLLAGMALTVLGAHWLVKGAVQIAQAQGVSDTFIGLTIVAIGTSAPELVTTLMATYRNDRDVAMGNLIGSSIYNILVILGLTCAVVPGGVDVSKEVVWIDMPLAAIVAILCLPVFKSGGEVSRAEGAAFVTAYLVYLGCVIAFRT